MNNTREIKEIVKQRARDYLYGDLSSKKRTITLRQEQFEKILALVWSMTVEDVDTLQNNGLSDEFKKWVVAAKDENMDTSNVLITASANAWQDIIEQL